MCWIECASDTWTDRKRYIIDPAIPFAWRHQMAWQARTISSAGHYPLVSAIAPVSAGAILLQARNKPARQEEDARWAKEEDVRRGLHSGACQSWRDAAKSEPQCLHFVAAGFRSSDRHAGQVLVGGGSPNTTLP